MEKLVEFIRESNEIEEIIREPTVEEISVVQRFLELNFVVPADLVGLVEVFQPDARYRCTSDCPNVRVGNHIAPPSGPAINKQLKEILEYVNTENQDYNNPVWVYQDYEQLHPFTDGNGRSGRVLWLYTSLRNSHWKELASTQLFLHTYHYQTLAAL